MLNLPRWKVILILGISVFGFVLALPNILPQQVRDAYPSWFPANTVVLGLDLQGGSHLLLEVDMKTVVQDMADSMADGVRDVLRKQKIGYVGISAKEGHVVFQLRNPSEFEKASLHIRAGDASLVVEKQGESRVVVKPSPESVAMRKRSAVEQSLEIVRRRVDDSGTREPIIQKQGEDRIILQLPGVDDPEHVKDLLGKTAKMTFRMVDMEHSIEEAMAGRIPPDSELLEMLDRDEGEPHYILVKNKVLVSGENLVNASAGIHPERGSPIVEFKFDSIGGKKFGDVTRENIDKLFAIVLDDKVISAPRIMSPITGGTGMIEGSFTMKSASDLALLLRAGALPAPLTVLEQRTVGPDLGADSIKAGQNATIIAVILVAFFMIIAYMFFGLIANVALIVNLVWLIGAMSALQATLTLPGIAGIALTLGMAVDANVLIYERVKEEIRNGMKPLSAIEAGYKRAMATVTDSNLTTLIGAAVLWWQGTGPVKGFAVTLGLGILISMFTAISLTRLIIIFWYRWRKPKTLPI
jgi:preprotein translocase subunit SecD